MSNLQQFVQQLQQDRDLQKRLGSVDQGDKSVVKLAAEKGFRLTETEVEALITQQHKQPNQLILSDGELEETSGTVKAQITKSVAYFLTICI